MDWQQGVAKDLKFSWKATFFLYSVAMRVRRALVCDERVPLGRGRVARCGVDGVGWVGVCVRR